MPHSVRQQAYTLIEVLVALMIFSILATITTHVLQNFLTQYRHIQQNYSFWHHVDRLINDLQFQTHFLVRRAIRANEGHLFPAFIGQHDYVEWTYVGTLEQQYRIAYSCRNGQLKQKTWTSLDTLHREQFKETVLLQKLTQCGFRFSNADHQISGFWNSEYDVNPKGMQLTLAWNDKQKIQIWFAFPPVRYDKKL